MSKYLQVTRYIPRHTLYPFEGGCNFSREWPHSKGYVWLICSVLWVFLTSRSLGPCYYHTRGGDFIGENERWWGRRARNEGKRESRGFNYVFSKKGERKKKWDDTIRAGRTHLRHVSFHVSLLDYCSSTVEYPVSSTLLTRIRTPYYST